MANRLRMRIERKLKMQTGLGKASARAREIERGSNWKNSQQLYANEVFLKLPKSAAKCRQKKEKRKEKKREHEKRRNQRKFLSCFDSLNLGVMLFRFGIHHNLLE